ncbi:MAG: NAD(P)-binding domain-containing protein, partial [Caldimonas sp.]
MKTPASLPRVGFVGLGVMGRPMASHLAAAGHSMQLFDIDPGVAEALAATLPDARASDIVVTMVPNGRVVRELVTGDDGLLHGLAAGALLLDTSSS